MLLMYSTFIVAQYMYNVADITNSIYQCSVQHAVHVQWILQVGEVNHAVMKHVRLTNYKTKSVDLISYTEKNLMFDNWI